jgi:[acyl-carrier-protein] S-malonyltransferase
VLALLFPGQGSQEVGMGRDAFEGSRAAREVFEQADAALGFALSKLCFEGPEEELRLTQNQQPAILTTSIALLRALQETGPVAPDFVAGHSLGEYSALVTAGALSFEDAVRLVHARGRYMQEAVAEGRGAMVAVMGCSAEVVVQACEEAALSTDRPVTPANFNAPQQTVIAGDAVAVEVAGSRARELGAKRAVPLPVSAPFHCELMIPAADKLALELQRVSFRDAEPPVVTNVEATPNASAKRMPELLEAQVTAPVRFTEMVASLRSLGVTHYLEIGPGRVLSGLVARIERRTQRAGLSTFSEIDVARSFVSESGFRG